MEQMSFKRWSEGWQLILLPKLKGNIVPVLCVYITDTMYYLYYKTLEVLNQVHVRNAIYLKSVHVSYLSLAWCILHFLWSKSPS